VTITTFEGGGRVAVNFSDSEQPAAGQSVPARSYLVLKGEVKQ